jgi:hypothetical protein
LRRATADRAVGGLALSPALSALCPRLAQRHRVNEGLGWPQMTAMLAIFAFMFLVPVVVITLDERRKRRRGESGDPIE